MGTIPKKSKSKSKKIIRKLKNKNNYNLRSSAFNSGVMAFSTDIIKSNTFKNLIKLSKKYGNIPYFGEQPIINLLFYKKWKKLPKPYNSFSFELSKSPDKKGSKVIIHFCHDVKPWIKKSDYYSIWKHNLKRADLIRINKPKIGKPVMTDFQMNIEYSLSKERIKIIIDRFLGFIGTILNKYFPKIYLISKKYKNKKPYRVCFWTPTFQSDILSFCRYLGNHPDYDVVVVLENPAGFKKEPVQLLLPVKAKFLDKDHRSTIIKVKLFRPHVTIVDGHLPPVRLARKLFVLWHGFGWRFDNFGGEFFYAHNAITKACGSGKKPNPNFIWQCFGPEDLKYRRDVSGFAEENLRMLGSAQSDDILNTNLDKEQVRAFYSIDIMNKPTVLLAFTWYHGKVFTQWGDDTKLFKELFAFAEDIGINLIVRMHDKFRYSNDYLEHLERLIENYDHVMFKFKNQDRDNLLDILVSDVMVSNFSSILNQFYFTEKPSIHIYPGVKHIWKLDPERNNGGLLVYSFEELKKAIKMATENPDCCKEKSRAFNKENITNVNGRTCERIERELRALINR